MPTELRETCRRGMSVGCRHAYHWGSGRIVIQPTRYAEAGPTTGFSKPRFGYGAQVVSPWLDSPKLHILLLCRHDRAQLSAAKRDRADRVPIGSAYGRIRAGHLAITSTAVGSPTPIVVAQAARSGPPSLRLSTGVRICLSKENPRAQESLRPAPRNKKISSGRRG